MPKKWINVVLSSAVFIIWIVVFYKFFFAQDNHDNLDKLTGKEALFNPVKKKANYADKKHRDPFQNPFNFRQKTKPKTKPKPIQQKRVKPLNIKLSGILTDERGKLAIIEFESGETHFMRVGDEVQGVKVAIIYDDEIEVVFEKRKIKVGL